MTIANPGDKLPITAMFINNIYSDFKQKFRTAITQSYSQKKILVEKRIIKLLNIGNRTVCFERKKFVWKSEGNFPIAKPKQGEISLKIFCELVT